MTIVVQPPPGDMRDARDMSPVELLKARTEAGMPSVQAVPRVLFAVNPKVELDYYDVAYQAPGDGSHIFDIADTTFHSAKTTPLQLVIFKGYTGSGKTTLQIKYLDRILDKDDTISPDYKAKLQRYLELVRYVVTAQTASNLDSSRACILVKLVLDADGRTVRGIEPGVRLWESPRIMSPHGKPIDQADGDRAYTQTPGGTNDSNIHVIEGVIASANAELGFDGSTNHRITAGTGDANLFDEWINGLRAIAGEAEADVDQVVRRYAAIVHLGDAAIAHAASQAGPCKAISTAARLLDFGSPHRLWRALKDGGAKVDADEWAKKCRGLGMALALRNMNTVLNLVKDALQIAPGPHPKDSKVIVIYDLPGFEVFRKNHLWQLLFNSSQEYLQYILENHLHNLCRGTDNVDGTLAPLSASFEASIGLLKSLDDKHIRSLRDNSLNIDPGTCDHYHFAAQVRYQLGSYGDDNLVVDPFSRALLQKIEQGTTDSDDEDSEDDDAPPPAQIGKITTGIGSMMEEMTKLQAAACASKHTYIVQCFNPNLEARARTLKWSLTEMETQLAAAGMPFISDNLAYIYDVSYTFEEFAEACHLNEPMALEDIDRTMRQLSGAADNLDSRDAYRVQLSQRRILMRTWLADKVLGHGAPSEQVVLDSQSDDLFADLDHAVDAGSEDDEGDIYDTAYAHGDMTLSIEAFSAYESQRQQAFGAEQRLFDTSSLLASAELKLATTVKELEEATSDGASLRQQLATVTDGLAASKDTTRCLEKELDQLRDSLAQAHEQLEDRDRQMRRIRDEQTAERAHVEEKDRDHASQLEELQSTNHDLTTELARQRSVASTAIVERDRQSIRIGQLSDDCERNAQVMSAVEARLHDSQVISQGLIVLSIKTAKFGTDNLLARLRESNRCICNFLDNISKPDERITHLSAITSAVVELGGSGHPVNQLLPRLAQLAMLRQWKGLMDEERSLLFTTARSVAQCFSARLTSFHLARAEDNIQAVTAAQLSNRILDVKSFQAELDNLLPDAVVNPAIVRLVEAFSERAGRFPAFTASDLGLYLAGHQGMINLHKNLPFHVRAQFAKLFAPPAAERSSA